MLCLSIFRLNSLEIFKSSTTKIRKISVLFTTHFKNWPKIREKLFSCCQSLHPVDLRTLTHSSLFWRMTLCNHTVRNFLPNVTQVHCSYLYPSITHTIQFHQTHRYTSKPKSGFKHAEWIQHWITKVSPGRYLNQVLISSTRIHLNVTTACLN